MLYEWRRGTSATDTAANINSAFEEDVVSYRTVRRWFNRFASGDTSLEDEPRSGRPTTIDDNELRRVIDENQEATTRELATALGCTHATIIHHLNTLGYRKVLARWIPHRLTDSNKYCRVTICQSLLLKDYRKDVLEDLVTGDESFILYENNTHRAVWLPRGAEPPVQPKLERHARKVLLCCWWDSKGMLYFELLPQGSLVSATTYVNQLERLAEAIREKRRRRVTVHLLHDNARAHVAKDTQQKLKELGWDTLPHPPYSPDIAPSDFHLFLHLKKYLSNKTFKNFEDLKRDVSEFFLSQPPQFWEKGIMDLPRRWARVIETDGEYIRD